MKCTFVYFSSKTGTFYSHAIAILSAIAKSQAFDVKVVNCENDDYHYYSKEIIKDFPDVIALSANTIHWADAVSISEYIKSINPRIQIWVGGVHITLLPELFDSSPFDAACIGEGEDIFAYALDALRMQQDFIHDAWLTKRYACGSRTILPNIVDDLNRYPKPDFSVFPKNVVLNYPSLIFSRGCTFHCCYCLSSNGGFGKRVRWKHPQRAIEECIELIKWCNPHEIYFDDDTIVKNIEWLKTFLYLYRHTIKIPFYCNTRPEIISEEVCCLLKQSGCAGVGIGVESGSEAIRLLLGRPMSDQIIIDAFNLCKNHELKTWSFNMLNIPGETKDDLISTIKLNTIIQPDYIRVSFFINYPGTPYYNGNELYRSYFSMNNLEDMELEKQQIIMSWLSQIEKENRLWND